MSNETLESKILNKKAIVSIIGMGYVGLPIAILFADAGYKTIGLDIDEHKVEMLNNGKSYINHIDSSTVLNIINNNFSASADFKLISKSDVIIIAVPTPLGKHNEPDLSFIHRTLELIKPHLKENQIIVLESTTYPGTTDEEIAPFIESLEISNKNPKGFIIGKNYFIGYSPEREDPGNSSYSTKTIPKIVSGLTKKCLNLCEILYSKIIDNTVPVSSVKVAEMTKILENTYRAVNIGLVNELKILSDKMGIDIYEVINAAATKPFGYTPYYPGPGLGGHCIPIDPFYLTWKAKEVGMNTRFIELAGEINASMPEYVVQKTTDALNTVAKAINNSKIIVLGLSYKKNVDDLRESPSLEIINILHNRGADISFIDPFFEKFPHTRKTTLKIKRKEMNENTISNADIVILVTDHDYFDYKMIKRKAKLIVDTRGKFDKSEKIIKA